MSDDVCATRLAIIGMAGRFPGADNIGQFWHNLVTSAESIERMSDQELLKAGVSAEEIRAESYVKSSAALKNADAFDPEFFGYTPAEAAAIDPQQRVFLETARDALESAGYYGSAVAGKVGVFAGVGSNDAMLRGAFAGDRNDPLARMEFVLANEKDFLATRVAYKLDLRGPCVTVQTACSTSLVAVHLACQSLLLGDSDIAIAGGVSINDWLLNGYVFEPGGVLSPDGHCRPFDANARGTVAGSGVGAVVLKRLTDAVRARDTIHAVIAGSAVNNDGARKVGFVAPTVDGQAAVIAEALAMAGVKASAVSFVEGHGTGTPLGDPIEFAALCAAFEGARRQQCALGSVKSNVGHLNAAAGVAGLLKAVLSLEHELIPPTLHFEQPNTNLDLHNSPFFVNTSPHPWPRGAASRYAGVSSFGLGGTNAHVIVTEPPAAHRVSCRRPYHAIVLSAKSVGALDTMRESLAAHFCAHPDLALCDVAHTLQVGREAFAERYSIGVASVHEAVEALRGRRQAIPFERSESPPSLAFLFPGHGPHHARMGAELYAAEPVYRRIIERCHDFVSCRFGLDFRQALYGTQASDDEHHDLLNDMSLSQPALFATELALAEYWMANGVVPEALLGHSTGEYVAACIAGVLSVESALQLVTWRGLLMQGLPPGGMLAVSLAPDDVSARLGPGASLAAVNAPTSCVVSGTLTAIEALIADLLADNVEYRRLPINRAAHSAMIDDTIPRFVAEARHIELLPAKIPFVSNVTGSWIMPGNTVGPEYWGEHLRSTVRFGDGARKLLEADFSVCLEVGPGHTLSSLVMLNRAPNEHVTTVASLPASKEGASDLRSVTEAAGRLWCAGVPGALRAATCGIEASRVPLPTYPYQRRHLARPAAIRSGDSTRNSTRTDASKRVDVSQWLYAPVWQQRVPGGATLPNAAGGPWAVFVSDGGPGEAVIKELRTRGDAVIAIRPGESFRVLGPEDVEVRHDASDDLMSLVAWLREKGCAPRTIVHCLASNDIPTGLPSMRDGIEDGKRTLFSLTFLARALSEHRLNGALDLWVVSQGIQDVTGKERLVPPRALVLGACKVIPQEYTNVRCRTVDLAIDEDDSEYASVARALIELATDGTDDLVLAYRDGRWWTERFVQLPSTLTTRADPLRNGGVYLITGGFGTIGSGLAEGIATLVPARFTLVSRPLEAMTDQNDPALDERAEEHQRIIDRLRSLGADVRVHYADVADRAAMRQVVHDTVAEWGTINGVIHAAAGFDTRSFVEISLLSRDDAATNLDAKVRGLAVLDEVLRPFDLDFAIALSSISAVLGGLGFATYAAANACVDGFARASRRRSRVRWTSINWDYWPGKRRRVTRDTTVTQFAMTPSEGMEVFRRIIAIRGAAQVVVSAGDLSRRLRDWVDLVSLRDAEPVTPRTTQKETHPISALALPATDIEVMVAEVWKEVLGRAPIGRCERFFDLGGHSLIAMRIVSRIRQQLNVLFGVEELLRAQTIEAVAAVLEARLLAEFEEASH